MSWIPCSVCHQAPCTCVAVCNCRCRGWTSGWLTYNTVSQISDADVERIARKLAEVLRADEPKVTSER